MQAMINSNNDSNDNDNAVSELISNSDQVIAGTPFQILRKKGRDKSIIKDSDNRGNGICNSITGDTLGKDICSLIQEFH